LSSTDWSNASWFFKERCRHSTAYGSFRATGNQAGPAGGFHLVECDGYPVNGVSSAALGNREDSLAQWATGFVADPAMGLPFRSVWEKASRTTPPWVVVSPRRMMSFMGLNAF